MQSHLSDEEIRSLEYIDIFKSINDFAEIVGIPSTTIREMVKKGELPTVSRGKEHKLIPLKQGSACLIEISLKAMREKLDFVTTTSPVLHVVEKPEIKNNKKKKGRTPDSIRLGRTAL